MVPCRLYGLLAREAPVGVIFRRGPSRWVQLIRWNTETDEFEPGQWLKGRVYERRCDLSPDGRLLGYFALAPRGDTYSYTAISRPPYFTALAIWFKEDCWSGGGLFESNHEFLINNSGAMHKTPLEIPHLTVRDAALPIGEDDPIQRVRMLRDGWTVVQEMDATMTPSEPPPRLAKEGEFTEEDFHELTLWMERDGAMQGFVTHAPEIMTKTTGKLTLQRSFSIDGFTPRYEFHLFYDNAPPRRLQCNSWADFDQRGRLVKEWQGRVLALDEIVDPDKELPVRVLADLNANVFEPVPPPDWATQWP